MLLRITILADTARRCFAKPHLRNVKTKAPVFEDLEVESLYWGKVCGYGDATTASHPHKLRPVAGRAGGHGVGVVIEPHKLTTLETLVKPLAWFLSSSRHAFHLLGTRSSQRWQHETSTAS
jgi:hypothetical protein